MTLTATRAIFFVLTMTLFTVQSDSDKTSGPITLFLSGDVMTGRGIDQILHESVPPVLFESYVKDARHYVELAEKANGPIQKPVPFAYVWGFSLEELDNRKPDIRLINLETSITVSGDAWEDKGVHYRMHPANTPVLSIARIDGVTMANNHTLDWGYGGFEETLSSLEKAGISFAGAGRNIREAAAPIVFTVRGRRILVFGIGMRGSGIPREWEATGKRPGVFLLEDFSEKSLLKVQKAVLQTARNDDLVIASIHWGGNWGYEVSQRQRDFAHSLIDDCEVDLVHGHSSHHVKGFEVYKRKLILYGCGDLITDYEGISGYESYRAGLGLLYFPTLNAAGNLKALEMVPTRMKRLQLVRPEDPEVDWLAEVLSRESTPECLPIEKTSFNTIRVEF